MIKYCTFCHLEILSPCLKIGEQFYHTKCAKCFYCSKQLDDPGKLFVSYVRMALTTGQS